MNRLTLSNENKTRKLYIVKNEDRFTVTVTMNDAAARIELDREQAKEIVEFLLEGLGC